MRTYLWWNLDSPEINGKAPVEFSKVKISCQQPKCWCQAESLILVPDVSLQYLVILLCVVWSKLQEHTAEDCSQHTAAFLRGTHMQACMLHILLIILYIIYGTWGCHAYLKSFLDNQPQNGIITYAWIVVAGKWNLGEGWGKKYSGRMGWGSPYSSREEIRPP